MRRLCWTLGFLACMTGCITADMSGDPSTGSSGGKADGTGSSGELAGRYALELTSNMKLEDTRETDPAKRYSTYALRARAQVTIEQSGDDLALSVKLCDVKLPEVSGYQPELDAGFVAGLPSIEITGLATHDGGLGLETDPAALVLGAKLHDVVEDALPSDPGDARIVDQDGDGKPGVSVAIPGYGKIYAAMRVRLAVSAAIDDPAAFSGDADLGLDEAIYGDSIWFYDAASAFAESQQYVKVVSASNKFQMKGHVSGCSAVDAAFP